MGGFFGVASKNDCMVDVFFGTDYHSHLGTRRGGMASYSEEIGLQRQIHNIENSPFRTRFENIFDEMKGNSAIGCISSMEPSVESLSATMTSAPSTFLTECRRPGRNFLRNPSVFQFSMTTAVFIY